MQLRVARARRCLSLESVFIFADAWGCTTEGIHIGFGAWERATGTGWRETFLQPSTRVWTGTTLTGEISMRAQQPRLRRAMHKAFVFNPQANSQEPSGRRQISGRSKDCECF